MQSNPGASYACPLVVEDSSPRKRQNVVCLDDSDDEDCKMPAKVARADGGASSPPASSQRRCRPFSSLAAAAARFESDSDEDQDAMLARKLQQEEWSSRNRRRGANKSNHSDNGTALDYLLMAEREGKDDDLELLAMESDASLAARLHREELEEQEQRKQDESAAMKTNLDGRAWLFVNQCLDLHKRLSKVAPGPTTVAVDDMVFLGKNFLQCIDDFEANGWPSQVTLAYHYTRSEGMNTIQTDGLMTLAERQKTYNSRISHGAVFGDGVYTATNPFAFRHFGDTGLLVAVVLGNATRVPYGSHPKASLRGKHVNTVIGNKTTRTTSNAASSNEGITYYDEFVLQESKQCLPLMRFETASVSTQAGKDAVWAFHEELQTLLDKVFNKGVPTQLTRIHESTSDPNAARAAASGRASSTARLASMIAAPPPAFISGAVPGASGQFPPMHLFRGVPSSATGFTGTFAAAPPTGTLSRSATLRPGPPAGVSAGTFSQSSTSRQHQLKPEVLKYTAPPALMESTPSDVFVSCKKVSDDECVICMEPLSSSGRAVRLKACGHEYHKQCIKGALKAKPNCPVCRVMVRKPQGTCPSGTMEITTTSTRCSGFNCNSSIVITYTMPSGMQLAYHENPGQRYHGTSRVAYLPDNTQGRKLLKRLKFAWLQGLTFTIGTSLTTRQPNCITWASIHHKTSPSGGSHAHGFPDAGFFLNCNAELDAAGVPKE